MLATVMALYNAPGLTSPLLCGGRTDSIAQNRAPRWNTTRAGTQPRQEQKKRQMNRGAFAHLLKVGLPVSFVVLAMSACGVVVRLSTRAPQIRSDNNRGESSQEEVTMQHSITTNALSRATWRVVCAFMVALLAGLMLTQKAADATQIKVHCEVYATNYVDPIALSPHLHHQIGNTSTTNESTGDSLFNNPTTSCDKPWFTSAGWFPVERFESIRGVNVYYRAPGDQRTINPIPEGLQLLATEKKYNCGRGTPFSSLPSYGCTGSWATSISFPDCINKSLLAEEATNAVKSRSGVCPITHPYRIPRINFLVSHTNTDGVVPNPLQVSAGVNAWEDYTFMHADYFAANQPIFNDQLLDLCLRNAPDNVVFADPRCGVPPGS
jgi:preprotein translocase subunit SecG